MVVERRTTSRAASPSQLSQLSQVRVRGARTGSTHLSGHVGGGLRGRMAIFTLAFVLVWLPSVVVYILSVQKEGLDGTKKMAQQNAKENVPSIPYFLLVLDALASLSLGFINFAIWYGPISRLHKQSRLRMRLERERRLSLTGADANQSAERGGERARTVSMTQMRDMSNSISKFQQQNPGGPSHLVS